MMEENISSFIRNPEEYLSVIQSDKDARHGYYLVICRKDGKQAFGMRFGVEEIITEITREKNVAGRKG